MQRLGAGRYEMNIAHIVRLSGFVYFYSFIACFAHGQMRPAPAQSGIVIVSGSVELGKLWRVREAGLKEQLSGTNGYLVLENVSGEILQRSIFYAEYFDATDRFCFSLTFSLARNVGDRTPVAPGDTRTVYSVAASLLPSVEPTYVRICLLFEGEQPNAVDQPTVRAPVTVSGNVESDASLLPLPAELMSRSDASIDLVLALVRVSDQGQLTGIEVLHSATPALGSWFIDFVRKLSFYPATESNRPLASTALISVLGVLAPDASVRFLASDSRTPWVKQYAEFATHESLPITQIVFGAPASKIQLPGSSSYEERSPLPAGMLELRFPGSDWSSSCYEWVRDASMPKHLTRKLAESDPH
jgi:hypothetical protein